MTIYHLISKFFPEGKYKNKFRRVFYKLIYSLTWGYEEVALDKEKTIFGKFYKPLFIKDSEPLNALLGYQRKYRLKRGDVVIDCGAFHGDFTIYAAKLVGEYGKVICFEPDAANFELLKRNIKLNNLKNVVLVQRGVWNENTTLKFWSHGADSALAESNNVDVYQQKIKNTLVEEVKVVRLDDFLKKINLKNVDFIKMDIEGAEIQALAGLKETISKNNVHFAIASYHVVNGEQTYKELERVFKKNKYSFKTEYPQHLTTYAKKN